ncbi:MAG: hypothetical protein JRN15_23150 [Nitrososphaerota archaeon]|nr:hypothetical protein [Nitrososphaerota archaeon]
MNTSQGAVNTTYYSPSCFLLGFGMQYSFGYCPTLPTGGNVTSFHTLTSYWSNCNINPA